MAKNRTTLDNITRAQLRALHAEAIEAGDLDTVRDCETVSRAYHDAIAGDLPGAIAEMTGEALAAAKRVVAVINHAEARDDGEPGPDDGPAILGSDLKGIRFTHGSRRTTDAWWAWHDRDSSRWSGGEDPNEATAEAERRCAAWVAGESDDGP